MHILYGGDIFVYIYICVHFHQLLLDEVEGWLEQGAAGSAVTQESP